MKIWNTILIFLVLAGCTTKKEKGGLISSVLAGPPPVLSLRVESDIKLSHVAILVDEIVNYVPLVIEPVGSGLSCSSDASKTLHQVTVLDHRDLPEPVVVESGGSVSDDKGDVTSRGSLSYDDGSMTKARGMFSSLKMLKSFYVSGSCDAQILVLKYQVLEDGSLSVQEQVDSRN